MPKVPIPSEQNLRTPRIAGAGNPARINPGVANAIGQAGNAWNRALSSLGDAIGTVAARSQAVESSQAYGQAQLEAMQRSTQAYDETVMSAGEDGTGLDAFPDKVSGIYADVFSRYKDRLTPEQQGKLQLSFAERGWKQGRQAIEAYQARKKDFFLGQLNSSVGSAERLTMTTPQNADDIIQSVFEQIQGAEGKIITSPQAAELRDKARQQIRMAQLQTIMRSDPEAGMQLFDQIERQTSETVREDAAFGGKAETDAVSTRAQISSDKPVSRFSRSVNRALNKAAAETGVSPQLLATFARIESSGRPNLVSSGGKGSYKGLFQLSSSEFYKYGGGNIFNPENNAMAGARKIKAEAARFAKKYGRQPTATDLYLVHQQGWGGYHQHMSKPNRKAWESMYATAEGRRKGKRWAKLAIWGNVPTDVRKQFPGGVDDVTSADFIRLWDAKVKRFGGGSVPAAASSVQDAPAVQLQDVEINSTKFGTIKISGDELSTMPFDRLSKILDAQRKETIQTTKNRINELEAQVAQGIPVADKDMTQIDAVMQSIGAADDKLVADYRTLRARNSVQQQLRGAPMPVIEQSVAQLEQQAGSSPTPDMVELIDAARSYRDSVRTQLKRDPLGFANAQGTIKLQPLNMQNLADSLRIRRRDANTAAATYAIEPQFFQPGEVQTLLTSIQRATPEQKMALIATMSDALGSQVSTALKELDQDPVFAHLAGLSLRTPQHRMTALTGFNGVQSMKAMQDGKIELPVKIKDVNERYIDQFDRLFGAGQQSNRSMMFQAAQAYAIQKLTENPSLNVDDTIDEALQAVAGRVTIGDQEFGGITKYNGQPVIMPTTMTEDLFNNTIERVGKDFEVLNQASVRGGEAFYGTNTPLTADDWDDVRLVSVGEGRYHLSLGEPGDDAAQPVFDSATGRPFILDLLAARKLLDNIPIEPAEPRRAREQPSTTDLNRSLQIGTPPQGGPRSR